MIVDLFAGPGGWDTGAALLGICGVLGVEWDGAACRTARAAGHARLQADIAKLDPAEFHDVSGLIASPPCQSFSRAGQRKGIDEAAELNPLRAHAAPARTRSATSSGSVHKPKRLSRARGGSITDQGNFVALCRPCHDHITTHPTWAEAAGWSLKTGEQSDG